ncbi:hypothetical protein QBC36DRAFT_368833 [Triangularia setosa]|uniref:Uncharacterized protein n=1 Tax=Triangularia setosa TaxID=2587417 RepID=A0AAN6WFZ6_9PEZI|nr:hypothetical protein QBC36DRAFT_368833 [Podospora setosa]
MAKSPKPPYLAALADAASTPIYTRPRTPPKQTCNIFLRAYKPPSPFTPPTHPYPFVKILGSTAQEIDAFFLLGHSEPNGVYILNPLPDGEPPRDEYTKVKRRIGRWMGGYGNISPSQLPRPVKEMVTGSDGVERGRWVGLRVDREIVKYYVQQGEGYSDSDDSGSEFGPWGQTEGYQADWGANRQGGKGKDGVQLENSGQVTLKEKGKAVEHRATQEDSGAEEAEEEDEEEAESSPDQATAKRAGKRGKLKETIKRLGKSLTVRKWPRMKEREDRTSGSNGGRGHRGSGIRWCLRNLRDI